MFVLFGDKCRLVFAEDQGGGIVCIDEESTLIVLGIENFESIFCIGDD